MIQIYTETLNGTDFAVALCEQQIVTSSFDVNPQRALSKVIDNVMHKLPPSIVFQVVLTPTAEAKAALNMLAAIYSGKDIDITQLTLATSHLPAYTKKVLKITSAIPIGYVSTYGDIAKSAGGGPRAVGNIMAGNLFAPIVPCHRVVKSDFTLGGYGFGLKTKLELLSRERRGFEAEKQVSVAGGMLEVFPVEYVLRKLA
jgi:methylated-DNA-[protein]-cysteine S-methyltransferase